ncbi:MAG: hypothetical protein EOO01_37990 [Chitinophagaceae bacterium]|nr:MAG: hypothetical protein EOO01_37990 [Chitinophagaceae bacterium]
MDEPRSHLRVVALNGLIYALGGRGANKQPTDRVDIFDPVTGFWSLRPKMVNLHR